MKKLLLCIAVVCAASCVISWGRDPATMTDAELIAKVRLVTQEEYSLTKVAFKNVYDREIRRLVAKILREEEKTNKELIHISRELGVHSPAVISANMADRLEKIKALHGENFDPDFLSMMIDMHKKEISVYTELAQRTKNPKIQAFIQKALVTEHHHLKALQTLAAPMMPDV